MSYASGLNNPLQPARLLCPWNFPGMNTGVGCHFLLQGIFPTPGSNLCLLCLLHWKTDSLPLVTPGKPQGSRCRYLNRMIEIEVRHELLGFPDGTSGKEPTCQCRRHKRCKFNPWVWKMPWRRAWQPTWVFLPGESHRGVWQATVHKVTKSQTQLSDWHFHFHELLMITKMDMGLNTVTPALKEHFQNQGMDIRVL